MNAARLRRAGLMCVALLLAACAASGPTADARFNLQLEQDLRSGGNRMLADPAREAQAHAALLADRRTELAAWSADQKYRDAYAEGDADRDLVPDRYDRCPNTPALATTDRDGCEYDCQRLADSRSKLVTPEECRRLALPAAEHARPMLDAMIPVNLACDGAATPSASSPLGWSPPFLLESGARPSDSPGRYEIWAIKLFASRAENSVPDCEMFYEFDVHLETNNGWRSARMLFSSHEEFNPADARIASFILPMARADFGPLVPGQPTWSSVSFPPISPGRDKARKSVFQGAHRVTWRVRAVNGMGDTQGWSGYMRHSPGRDLSLGN